MKSRFKLLLWTWMLTITACSTVTPQTAAPSPLPTALPIGSPSSSSEPAGGSSLRGVFEGITPCSAQARALPQIPKDSDCELMIWKISFYQDAGGTPTTYMLESTYGVSQPNTTGPAGGGTAISMEGNWSIAQGTKTDSEAEVYQLHSEDSQVAVSFVKLSEDLLHVLNRDKTLMLGNAGWSYTLNRTDNHVPFKMQPISEPPLPTRPPIPDTPPGSSVLGAFEGRVPCHEIVLELAQIPAYDGCAKIKSRLTLYLDQATGAPSTYVYLGTHIVREGTWTIIEGTEDDPHSVIYQIHMDDSQEPVSFLKADENHLFLLDRDLNLLVGNALFSYTLSRIE